MKVLKKILLSAVLVLGYSNLVFAGSIEGKVAVKGIKSPAGVIIYVEKAEGNFKPPEERPKIDQVNLVFIPRVLPVVVGTTVEFHNSDTVLHNVFAVGDDEFDLGTWKGDEIRTYTFNRVGEVAILCNVHPEMEAYALVLQNPYFALTDESGNYKIKDVPGGVYTLKTWHDSLRPAGKEIEMPAKEEITVDFTLKK